jgi:hypothetical protein
LGEVRIGSSSCAVAAEAKRSTVSRASSKSKSLLIFGTILRYSAECVEGEFSEVGYPLDFVTLVVTFERR